MSEASGIGPVVREGANCWRVARAQRAAVIVDAADYFEAAARAIELARHSVMMVGWDVHSRVRLRRRAQPSEEGLVELLDRVAARHGGPRVRLLAWDWPMLYALEREAVPRLRLGHATHRRVDFRLDGAHPFGGSQHQKIVVVDDAVAFCGGLDITACRWDTPEHLVEDPRRCDPGFSAFGPFHDVQMAVDGDAARALGELVRERWRRATGRRLAAPRGKSDRWPDGLHVDFEDVDVAIARTFPEYEGRPAVREVEALYVDALRSAQRWVYLENQYLTSRIVADVLGALLERPGGPEVVIVVPFACSGWLEEHSMGVLRARLLSRLRERDREGRLRVYYPRLPDDDDATLFVHSKLMIVDDRILRVGSANLADRSMGLDSECDLAVELAPDHPSHAAIARTRDRLLGEHLGAEPGAVTRALESSGSLIGAIERLRGGPRSLAALEVRLDPRVDAVTPDPEILDPECPIGVDEFVRRVLPETLADPEERASWLRLGALAVALSALALVWRFTPVGELASPERLAALAEPFRGGPLGIALALVGFAVAGISMVPVVALIVACALVYGWGVGSLIALAGSLLTAALGYFVGAHVAKDSLRRLMGRRGNELSRRLARRGTLAVAALRFVPLAPFTVVNLAAGASHVSWRDFAAGTVLGMLPGVILLCLAADRAAAAFVEPGWGTALTALGVLVLLLAAGAVGRRLLGRRGADGAD